ncbi:MAG: carboxypeptidase-like regulatory domain-containing protein [Flavobacteriaceae bacterium]
MILNSKGILFLMAFICALNLTVAQKNIAGTVLDQEGNPLVGATIILKGKNQGVIANDQGAFSIETTETLPIEIEISYVGFRSQSYTYTSFNAQTFYLSFTNRFDEVIVSASRNAEKLQEAPAAV